MRAAALFERDGGLTSQEPPDRFADQLAAPAGRQAAAARRDERGEIGAGREQRRFEIELGCPLRDPRADDRDGRREGSVGDVGLRESQLVGGQRDAELHGGEDRVGDAVAHVATVESAHRRQVFSAWSVRVARCSRARGRGARSAEEDRRARLRARAHAPTSCATPRALPRSWRLPLMRHHAVAGSGRPCARNRRSSHSSRRPLEPAVLGQSLDECVVQCREVFDIRGGVRALVGGERPAGPVGEPIALGEPDAEHPFAQCRERRCAVAEEPGGDLRVEQVRRAHAARAFENGEVLVAGVRDERAGAGEHRCQRGDVDGHRVDDREAAGPGDLHQREPGVVGALALELRVEAVEGLVTERADEVVEPGCVGDELHIGHGRSLPDPAVASRAAAAAYRGEPVHPNGMHPSTGRYRHNEALAAKGTRGMAAAVIDLTAAGRGLHLVDLENLLADPWARGPGVGRGARPVPRARRLLRRRPGVRRRQPVVDGRARLGPARFGAGDLVSSLRGARTAGCRQQAARVGAARLGRAAVRSARGRQRRRSVRGSARCRARPDSRYASSHDRKRSRIASPACTFRRIGSSTTGRRRVRS